MLRHGLLHELVALLNRDKIKFCHWKSNWGDGLQFDDASDVDFLVEHSHRPKFEQIAFSLGFEAAREPSWAATDGVAHYYGFDPAADQLVHLHIYYRLNTAGELLKNYHFAVESLLLSQCEMHRDGIPRPTPVTEAVLLIIRKLLEHTSLLEFLLLRRARKQVNEELRGLVVDSQTFIGASEQYQKILLQYFPEVVWETFYAAALKFIRHGVSVKLISHGRTIARQLSSSRKHSWIEAGWQRCRRLSYRIFYRGCLKRRPHTLASGGRIVAVVGSDASGKSTVVQNLSAWLGQNLDVMCIHSGKPPATLLTFLPLKLVPLLRRLLPASRSVNISINMHSAERLSRLSASLFVMRALMVAYDRAALLRRAEKARRHGRIVISDRFPSATIGAMDSAALSASDSKLSACPALGFFAAIERRLYDKMPKADCILRLSVELEVAIARNHARIKAGSEGVDWIKFRHKQAMLGKYPEARECVIDTNGDLPITLRQARQATWSAISGVIVSTESEARSSAEA